MSDALKQLGEKFRKLATQHDELVTIQDEPDSATDALGDEIGELTQEMEQIPATDLEGFRIKAAVYAHYNAGGYVEPILESLLHDLLRGTPDYKWLQFGALKSGCPVPAFTLAALGRSAPRQ